MRALKFRAWDLEQKKMRTVMALNWDWQTGAIEDVSCCEGYGASYHDPVERFVIMQSTGLRDRKGVEVFEGDVVHRYSYLDKENPLKMKVFWNEAGCGWSLRSNIWTMCLSNLCIIEVIGNIHQHPELLNKPPEARERGKR